jgi:hypothetical protein
MALSRPYGTWFPIAIGNRVLQNCLTLSSLTPLRASVTMNRGCLPFAGCMMMVELVVVSATSIAFLAEGSFIGTDTALVAFLYEFDVKIAYLFKSFVFCIWFAIDYTS